MFDLATQSKSALASLIQAAQTLARRKRASYSTVARLSTKALVEKLGKTLGG